MWRGSYAAAVLAARLACAAVAAPQEEDAAFLLVGAAYDVDAARLRSLERNVAAAFGAAERLVFLKGVHFDGSAYSPDEIAALERTTIDAFKPSVVDVRSGDALTARFEADARKLGNCVWPNGRGPEVRYGRASERERMVKRVSHWWGALQAALNGLAAREKARGKVFSKVAACRADADVVAPVRSASSLQTRYVYATSDPPDALWLFGDRASAEAVLGTYAGVAAVEKAATCRTEFAYSFFQSWFPVCWAAKRLFDAGVRVVADPNITGHVVVHTGGGHPGRKELTGFATDTRTTFLAGNAYDANVHARPAAAACVGMCGPWCSKKHNVRCADSCPAELLKMQARKKPHIGRIRGAPP